jgi:hypothetical protein
MAKSTGIVAQGELAERSRMEQLTQEGASSVNLNEVVERHNFPMVDLCSEQGFESVKGYLSAQAIVDHLRDIQAPVEWASSKILVAREQAAKAIVAVAKTIQGAKAWPRDVKENAGVEELKTELADKTKVAAPTDRISEVKQLIEAEVPESPEAWGVKMDAPDLKAAIVERIGELTSRVVDSGKMAAELIEHAEASVAESTQSLRPAVETGSNLERLALPQPEPASADHTVAPEPASPASPATLPAMPPPTPPASNPGGFGPV